MGSIAVFVQENLVMQRRLAAAALGGVLAIDFLFSTAMAADWLYGTVGWNLVRSHLDGSGLEVVTQHPNPHCSLVDFDIDTSGVPYLVTNCTTPIENLVIRLRPDYEWEELIRVSNPGGAITSIELSEWTGSEILYYSKFGDIRLMLLDRSFDMQLVSGSEFIVGLDVDSRYDKIYWVRVPYDPAAREGRIMRAGRLQQNDTVETFVTVVGSKPNDVSVDEVNGIVYWSNSDEGTIQRAQLNDPRNVETVVQGLAVPTGIAIHADSRKLYWAEKDRVRRSNLDGSMVEDILNLSGVYRIGFGPDLLVGVKQKTWGQVKQLFH